MHIQNKHRDTAASLLRRIGLCKHDTVVCHWRTADKCFSSVQDKAAVFLFHGSCCRAAGIRACTWLCQCKRHDLFAFCNRRKIFLLLFFTSGKHQRTTSKGIGCVRVNGQYRRYTCKLFYKNCIGKIISAGSAVFLRDLYAAETVLRHLLKNVPVKVSRFFQFVQKFFGKLCLGELSAQLLKSGMFLI